VRCEVLGGAVVFTLEADLGGHVGGGAPDPAAEGRSPLHPPPGGGGGLHPWPGSGGRGAGGCADGDDEAEVRQHAVARAVQEHVLRLHVTGRGRKGTPGKGGGVGIVNKAASPWTPPPVLPLGAVHQIPAMDVVQREGHRGQTAGKTPSYTTLDGHGPDRAPGQSAGSPLGEVRTEGSVWGLFRWKGMGSVDR